MSSNPGWVVTTGLILGMGIVTCGGSDPAPAPARSSCWMEQGAPVATPTWAAVGSDLAGLPLDALGQTARVDLAPPAGTGTVTLRAFDAAPVGAPACVQLVQLEDAGGTNWVAPSDPGPYCLGCPTRVSLGIGYGLFVLPSNDRPPPFTAPLGLRVAALDCPAAPRDGPSAPTHLRLEARFAPAVPATRAGQLALGLAFVGTSPLADPAPRDAVIPTALAMVNQMLAPGQLQAAVVRTRLVDAPETLELVRNDNHALDEVYQEVRGGAACTPPAEDGWIPIVFVGCIRITDPDLQTSYQPDGLTPGIPNGFPPPGRAHGIFLKGRSCRPGADPIDWPPSLLAKLIAHELGHYLGLYHTVEADGTLDQLADTDAHNLMFARPLDAEAQDFSPAQFQVMRRHPAIRW